ncbi:C-type mannose receptor 2-like [Simochromis diagramma]|uniref:C-type mannose receptor 2-like n=1 Tax=Simochromis diagramma TaxID=43689 RepID=UPI001A7E6312|nr:C-type mannose receptor 2-like [Simochromis diagramma]
MAGIMHLLLLSGLSFQFSHGLQPQFVFFQTPKTWSEAQSICREQCFDLATINHMREMEIVLEAVKDKYDDAVWTGLSKGTTLRWHWSLADDDFYKEGERNYLLWSSVNNNNCAVSSNGKLNMLSCANQKYSVCFDATKQGADQYILNTQGMVWTAARDYCRTHYTDLTSLRNDAEYQIVQQVANGNEVYVGLFRDPWEWSDQTDSSFRYWNPDKTVWTDNTQTCVAMLKVNSGKWGDRACTEAHPFVCDCRNKLSFIELRISPQDSMLDLSNPSVQADILEQMNQKLRSYNTTAVFHLTWRKQSDGRVFTKEP